MPFFKIAVTTSIVVYKETELIMLFLYNVQITKINLLPLTQDN